MREILAAVLLLLAAAPAWALAEKGYGVRSLAGLAAVRVEFESAGGVDAVDGEVVLLQRLREAGIAVEADAPAVLRADVRAGAEGASAELTLTQGVCLMRDPAVSEQVPTWFQGTAVRAGEGRESGLAAVAGLAMLADEFVGDWRGANARP
jgi:hypothetical protein